MELSDTHVVVTGAAGGIGTALARAFSDAGARLTVSDLHGAASLADELDNTVSVAADIALESDVKALIDQAKSVNGPIDLYFANAGVAAGTDPMDSEQSWEFVFDVNFHAHRWAARYLLPDWLEREQGYFCSTASAAGLLSQIGSAHYSVTKHAAVAFAEWLSLTYGARGLTVSCLCPQGVNTNMINQNIGSVDDPGDIVRHVGSILEPEAVAAITLEAIRNDQFLILPHPEVAGYLEYKATNIEGWLAGMRKLQRRIMGV